VPPPSIRSLPSAAAAAAALAALAAARQRRLAGLFRHYYPEGGWGWAVATCGAAATCLAGGAQASAGLLGPAAAARWSIRNFAIVGE